MKDSALRLAQLAKHRQVNEWCALLQSPNSPRPKGTVSALGAFIDALLRSFILSILKFEFMYALPCSYPFDILLVCSTVKKIRAMGSSLTMYT